MRAVPAPALGPKPAPVPAATTALGYPPSRADAQAHARASALSQAFGVFWLFGQKCPKIDLRTQNHHLRFTVDSQESSLLDCVPARVGRLLARHRWPPLVVAVARWPWSAGLLREQVWKAEAGPSAIGVELAQLSIRKLAKVSISNDIAMVNNLVSPNEGVSDLLAAAGGSSFEIGLQRSYQRRQGQLRHPPRSFALPKLPTGAWPHNKCEQVE